MGIKSLAKPKYYKDCCAGLRYGWWGNTWREWGEILLAMLGLYIVTALLFTACLFSAWAMRNDQFLSLPVRQFGPYSRTRLPVLSSTESTFNQIQFFNPALECTQLTREVSGSDLTASAGIAACKNTEANTGKGYGWALYPWVLQLQGTFDSDSDVPEGLNAYPGCQTNCDDSDSGIFAEGCAQKTKMSYIARTTSPAYWAGTNVPVIDYDGFEDDVDAVVCQNNFPYGNDGVVTFARR